MSKTRTARKVTLGYENGEKLEATAVLKPVGSKDRMWVRGLHGDPVLKTSQSAQQLSKISGDFVVPPIKPVNKHIEESGYNSLTDPHLKKFFKKTTSRKCVTDQGLATDDLQVLDSPKKAHSRKYFETLSNAKIHELEESKRKAIIRRHKKLLEDNEQRAAAKKAFRKQKEAEKRKQGEMLARVKVNRVSVTQSEPTVRDKEYIDENRELAETRIEMDSIKKIQLDAATQFKQAAIDRRLAEETATRKAALKERIHADATQLEQVKETINKNKEAQKATREKIEAMSKQRREQVKAESAEFRDTMQKVFEERAASQKAEIAARAQARAENEALVSQRRAKIEAEKLARRQAAEAQQRALMTSLRAETFREEQIRKMEDEARKEASRIAKEKRTAELAAKAEANRVAVAADKEAMRLLEIERLRKIEQQKLDQKARNIESKKKREEAIAIAEGIKAEKLRRETIMDIAAQAAIKQANAEAYMAEQKLLWEKAMKEAERDEIKKKRDAKKAAKQEKIAQYEAQKAARAEKLREEKVAADKIKAQQKLKETMVKMQAEVDRQIANMAKGLA